MKLTLFGATGVGRHVVTTHYASAAAAAAFHAREKRDGRTR